MLKCGGFYVRQPTDRPQAWARPKRCFVNAARLAATRRDELQYVEGWAWGKVPLHHAWCVDRDGNVVDPTWEPDPLLDAYFGVPFDLVDVSIAIVASGSVLLDHANRYPILRMKGATDVDNDHD
mgnify:FL=1